MVGTEAVMPDIDVLDWAREEVDAGEGGSK